MQIQVNTDNHIQGSERLTRHVEAVVEGSVGRFADRITRVEVHLSDDNSSVKSGGDDKRCLIEARLATLRPISVSHHAASVELAIDGAADKLQRIVKRTFERLADPGRGHTPRGETEIS
jgi:ribosome-associated translation inhibitor RaiA